MTDDPRPCASGGTVLVTGGAGFIGTAVAKRSAGEFERWVVVDALHPQVHNPRERPDALHDAAELVVGDITDPSVWDELLRDFRPDTVLHLAAETGTAQSLHEATRHAHVNVVGTTAMLDALGRSEHVPSHFVLSSSRSVYGEGRWTRADGSHFLPGSRSHAQLEAGEWDFPDARPTPSSVATTPPSPTSVYGATKLAQEHVLRAWTASHDSSLSILRLQNVYGPGQSLINSYTGIVSLFSQMAARRNSIPVYEDGQITRDFVFIDDVAEAFGQVMALGPGREQSIFDVGSGTGATILELATRIAEFHDAPEPHITGAYRDGDVRHAECVIDDTLAGLEWVPRWDLQRGVAALQDWIASRG